MIRGRGETETETEFSLDLVIYLQCEDVYCIGKIFI